MQAQDDWISAIPTGWKSLSLKRVASIESSGSYGDEEGVLDRDLPVCTTATVLANGEFNFEKMPIRSFSEKDVERYAVQPKDILVVKSSGSATNIISGKSAQVDENRYGFVYTNFLMRIRATNIESDYLSHFLKSGLVVERIKRMVSTTTYPNISVPLYSMQAIFFPPKIKQQKIADFLDQETAKIDNLIAKQERLLELLEEKRRATITRAVTRGLNPNVELTETYNLWIPYTPKSWTIGTLRHHAIVETGGTPSRDNPEFWNNGSIPWMASGEVNLRRVNQTKEYITELASQSTNAKLLPKGTVMMALNGQGKTKGMVAVLEIGAACNQSLVGIRCSTVINPYFLYYYLLSRYKDIRGLVGDHRDGLNMEHVRSLSIPLADTSEQKAIVDYLEEHERKSDDLKQKIQTQIALLRERRTSLISHAVTGKIKV